MEEREKTFTSDIREKYRKLNEFFKEDKYCVLFSGGVDSGLLAMLAQKYDSNVVFIDSPLVPTYMKERIEELMDKYKWEILALKINEMENKDFYNSSYEERCYFCKKIRIIKVKEIFNNSPIVDGTNADDLKERRPGIKALRESKVLTPLANFGFTKNEIRKIARELGYPYWNYPHESCLATRIREKISLKALREIDQIEEMARKILGDNSWIRFRFDEKVLEIEDKDKHKLKSFPYPVRIRKFN